MMCGTRAILGTFVILERPNVVFLWETWLESDVCKVRLHALGFGVLGDAGFQV